MITTGLTMRYVRSGNMVRVIRVNDKFAFVEITTRRGSSQKTELPVCELLESLRSGRATSEQS